MQLDRLSLVVVRFYSGDRQMPLSRLDRKFKSILLVIASLFVLARITAQAAQNAGAERLQGNRDMQIVVSGPGIRVATAGERLLRNPSYEVDQERYAV